LPDEARSRLEIAIYEEMIRFSIVLVDERVSIVQPYLPAMRGADSPALVVQREWEDQGLVPVFEAVLSSLWTRARPVRSIGVIICLSPRERWTWRRRSFSGARPRW